MSKKNFDYKVTITFEMSGHNCMQYQSDKMIKDNALQLLKQHLEEVKNPKCIKIERNYTHAKWLKDRKKRKAA
jgi:hypothetical protein|tara:strand:+ start:192 stop:410 length:219 start_codon:yes stop_codon:yes gene_type:complete